MAYLGDTKVVSLTLLDGVIGHVLPKTNNVYNLGSSSLKWANMYATTFNGNATSATKATQDSDGNAINSTYIKKSVLSGAYDIMYSSAANTPARLAANTTTTKKFLTMTGTGSAGAAPIWNTIVWGDVGSKPSSYTPSSHAHGELTNDGKLTNASKLAWTTSDGALHSGSHYADGNKVAINSTDEPVTPFHVQGNTTITRNNKANLYLEFSSTHQDINRTISMRISSTSNYFGFYDHDHSQWIFQNQSDGTNVFYGNATTATAIQTAGTTAQFYRGDNAWSNTLKQTANAVLGIDTNLKIGTARKDLNFDITNGSGSGINDGYAGGITWGNGTSAYAGIYYQTSGAYGSRLHFATTDSYANGAYTRLFIQSNGNVGIGTIQPTTLFQVNGSSTFQHIYNQTNASYDIGATAKRWRTIYLSTSLLVGAASTITAYNSNEVGSFIGSGVQSICTTTKDNTELLSTNGYYLFSNSAQYARLYTYKVGVASTTTTFTNPSNTSQRVTGYINGQNGEVYLTLGNDLVGGSNGSGYSSPGSATTANNAQGFLRLYSLKDGYADLTALKGDSTRIYPTNGFSIPVNKVGIMFRPDNSGYYTHFSYQTSGNEAWVAATQNAVTSFIFVNGEAAANITSSRWYNLTPGLQIKQNCVSIGQLVPHGTTPAYRLAVSGQTYLGNTTASTTTTLSAQAIVSNINGGNVAIELYRGTKTSWQIANEGGTLYLRDNYGSPNANTTYNHTALFIKYNNGGITVSNSITPGANNTYELGSETNRWKTLYMESQTNCTTNGIVFYTGTTIKGRMGSSASSGAFGIYATDILYLRPDLSDTSKGVEVRSGSFVPTSDLSINLGASTNRWSNIYGNTLRLQGASSNPSTSAGARIEFTYDSGTVRQQPVYICYTPNDSYRVPAGLKIMGNGLTSSNGSTEYSSPAWLEVEGAFFSTDLYVDKTRLNDNWLGFYSAVNGSGTRLGYIQGGSDYMYFRLESTATAFNYNGNLIPNETGTKQVGISDRRWKFYGSYLNISGDALITGAATFNSTVTMNSSATIDSLTAGSLTVSGNSSLVNTANTAALLPHATTTYDIGSSSLKYNNIYATKFNGEVTNVTTTADTTNSLYLVGVTSSATTTLKRDTSITMNAGNMALVNLYSTGICVRFLDAARNSINSDHNLYIGYGSQTYTEKTLFYYSTGTSDAASSRTKFAELNNNGLYALTRFGVNGQNTSYNFYVDGTSCLNGNTTPGANLSYNLGTSSYRWSKVYAGNLYGNITMNYIKPIASKTYSAYTCTSDNEAKGVLFFFKINIANLEPWDTNHPWQKPWAIHYRVYVQTTEANTQGWYDCYFSVQGSTVTYYNYNNFYSNDYRPIYHHRLIYPKSGYQSYGAYAGVRVQSSRSPAALARTFKVELLEAINCTVEVLDSIKRFDEVYITTNSVAASTIWYNTDYNGTSAGLQESGDTNSNDTGYYIRYSNGTYTTSTALYRYQMLLQKDETTLIPLNTTSNSTANTKTTLTTASFMIFGVYGYYPTTATINANGAIGVGNMMIQYPFDLRYSFNIASTLTTNKDVYLVAIPDGDGVHAKLRNPGATGDNAAATATGANAGPITQTLPNSDDGYIYIKLGHSYSAYTIMLTMDHPVYWFKDGKLREYSSYAGTYLKLSGGTMTGAVTVKGFKGTSNVDYGTTLPSSPTAGQIFFQISDPYHELPSGGTAGQALIKNSNSNYDVTWGDAGGRITLTTNNSTRIYPSGYAGSSSPSSEIAETLYSCSNVYIENSVIHGACWNDYAEYRKTKEVIKPGHCIIENGDGTLSLSTERMQPGAEIVSDTYGFVIGQTKKCNTPIAVSGRVLAYMYEDYEDIKIGAPVCSGPNGTVSQMTEDEARNYPWLVIGTVSAIPQEKEWGERKVKVDGRVWIRVR